MLKRPEIEELKLLAHGRLKEPDSHLSSDANDTHDRTQLCGEPKKLNLVLGRARSIVAQSMPAIALYERLIPTFEGYSMRRYNQQDVYHSPNYMLPNFPGRRVVSILDLSTYRYPEQHPKARVHFVNNHIQRTLEHADHIITISDLVKNEIIERFNYPNDRITVTYLGASDAFRPHTMQEFQQLGKSLQIDYKGYFLFVSSIEPRKNLERLLDAYLVYSAESTTRPFPLVVTGMTGWKSQHIHSRLKQSTTRGDVRYLGYVNQKILPALMAGARSLLYPSLYEGFGLPVLEAMQSGTAVMTSESTAMAEIGGTAVMQINPTDVNAMVDMLTHIDRDSTAIGTLERKGLDTAKHFSWQRCAEQTLEAYQSAIR
jgi:alpha-1,3-rhamnosyl/mannosyltransferase